MSAEGATQDRTGDGRDGKIRRTSNARRDGKLDGQTGASGEQRATKRENGTGGGVGNVGRTAVNETGKRYGPEGKVERIAHDGTGDRDSMGGRR